MAASGIPAWDFRPSLRCYSVGRDNSLRFYFLGSNWERRVEHHGAKKPADLGGLIMIE